VPSIHRHEVPVDGDWHDIELAGDILHVDARTADVVELWAVAGHAPARRRSFRAFGTGQELPTAGQLAHRGTALAPHGLVWHLMERHP
jgi:hypothetical protein